MCTVLDKVFSDGERKGEERGEEKGLIKGLIKGMISLLEKGKITVEDAAEEANLSVEEFTARMNELKKEINK